MAIKLPDFDGANSGSLHTLVPGQVDVTVVTSPAPLSSKETYVYKIANVASPSKLVADTFAPGTDWITIGFLARWDSLGTTTAIPEFFRANEASPHVYLKWDKSNGDVKVYDANNSLVATVAGAITVDTWPLMEMKFKLSNTSAFQLRIGESLVVNLSSMDCQSGSATNVAPMWTNGSNPADIVNVFIGSYYVFTDDGATIDTNNTFLGDYTVLGSFESDTQGSTGDFAGEDTLGSASTLAMCQDTPADDGDSAKLVIVGETQQKIGIVTDHTTNSVGGPRDNPDFDYLIKGGKWTWRHTGPNAQFGQDMKFFGRYGRQSNVNKNLPAVVETPAFGVALTTTKANLSVVEIFDSINGNVPNEVEWCQQGFRIVNNFTAQKTGECVDMWNQFLHQEPLSDITVLRRRRETC